MKKYRVWMVTTELDQRSSKHKPINAAIAGIEEDGGEIIDVVHIEGSLYMIKYYAAKVPTKF